jgi:hypothetical protein
VAQTAKQIALLGLVLAIVAVLGGQAASRHYGERAYQASAVAAGIVGLSGALSLCVVGAAATPAGRIQAILLAMLVRLALPLAAMAFFTATRHALLHYGIAPLLVIYYLAGLALETWMSVRLVAQGALSKSRTDVCGDLV